MLPEFSFPTVMYGIALLLGAFAYTHYHLITIRCHRATWGRVPKYDRDHSRMEFIHQTRHTGRRTIGWPTLHENALENSGMLETTPLIRYSSGECGLVMALSRLFSGRSSPQAHCATPMKNRWSGVKPPIGFKSCPLVASFQAR